MEKSKFLKRVTKPEVNKAGLITKFINSFYYKNFTEPLDFIIYPHEFNTWRDFYLLIQSQKIQGNKLIDVRLKEIAEKNDQYDLFY